MGRENAFKSHLLVLFSTVLVYTGAKAQSADDLYRQIKKNPNMSKEQVDQAKVEALDAGRMQRLNDRNRKEQKQDEAINKKLASEPPMPEGVDDDKAVQQPAAVSGNRTQPARSAEAPPSAPATNTSSDTPKVAFDPMPDEIKFDSDEGQAPAPSPASKPPRPPKRKLHQ